MKKHRTAKALAFLISTSILFLLLTTLSNAIERKHFSEKSQIPHMVLPGNFTKNFLQISAENINQLQQVSILPSNEESDVMILLEGVGPDELLAIYKNGDFIHWNIATDEAISKKKFFVVDEDVTSLTVSDARKVVSISSNGLYAMTPNEISPDRFVGYNLWDITTLERLYCDGNKEYCSNGGDPSYLKNSILHPTRDVEFHSFNRLVAGSYGFVNGNGGSFYLHARDEEETDVARLAVDPLGDYFAIVDVQGLITIGDISAHKAPFPKEQFHGFSAEASYELAGFSERKIETIDLKFDETHSWLGWLTDENLVIWSLQNYWLPLYFKMNITHGNAVCFDRAGQLVAVATQKGITLIDAKDKKILREISADNVTAVYFSRDNRLLIWGNAKGDIYLWGVPN